ncbi:MAG: response regulator, partial [Armatimonadetes bacterium]|nr:response regulator [Armatimonadota bacterium]
MRVLIADDDPIIRLDLKQMLETLGYSVVAEAEDGQQAVDLAKSSKPDACVLDVKMPVKDGIDAATEIADGGIAPAVLLTAY